MTGSHDFSHALNALNALSAQLKVVTYGEQGAMVLWRDSVIHFDGYTVNSVDTTGAGDAFVAGLLAGLHIAGCRRMLNNSTSPWLRPAPAVPSRQRARGADRAT